MNDMTDDDAALTVVPQQGLIGAILEMAKNPNFSPDTFRLLMSEHERLTKDRQRKEFEIAFVRFQNKVEDIKKSGKNPLFNNWYSKIEDLDAAARPAYVECGFGIRYGYGESKKGADWLRCTCTLSHIGGHWVDNEIDMPIDYQQGARARTDTQAVASTTTYGWRILMRGALNLVAKNNPHDNDGETKVRPRSDYVEMNEKDSASWCKSLIEEFQTLSFATVAEVQDYAKGRASVFYSLRKPDQKKVQDVVDGIKKVIADKVQDVVKQATAGEDNEAARS